MSTTVQTEGPRQVTISANPSSSSIPLTGGVQIDREVVVTSSLRNSARRNASYSHIPPLANGHTRAQSHDPASSRPHIDRARSEVSLKRRSRPTTSQYDYHGTYLDTNRESMRALAEFLMSREPPPGNFMSIPSDDEISLRGAKRFKLFGPVKKKKNRRTPKERKLMRLPDVAVAATTRQGARHIAISIPLEHDFPELLKPSVRSSHPAPRPRTAPMLLSSDRGAVTVLKPVVEVRESVSTISPPNTGGSAPLDSGRIRAASVATPPNEVLGPEATRTLENYYAQLQLQQQKYKTEGKRPETARGLPRTTGANHSTGTTDVRTDLRYSGGTVYSTATFSTAPGHSRGASSVSTAPSAIAMSGVRLDLPPRHSSKSTIPGSIEHDLRLESAKIATTERAKQGHKPSKSTSESIQSGTSSSHTPPTIFGIATAETALGYHSPGPQYFSRTNTPLSSSAPNKKLPELPPGAQIARPSTAPLSRNSTPNESMTKRTSSVKDTTSDLVKATQQSRQERVKARKLRDLASIRARLETNSPTETRTKIEDLIPPPVLPPPQIQSQPAPKSSSRSHKHRTSQELALKRSQNSISPIMVVANLPPFTGLVLPSDLPSPPMRKTSHLEGLKKSTSRSSNSMAKVVHTPPRSSHEGFDAFDGSDSDTIPTRPQSMSTSRSVHRTHSDLGRNNSTLEQRRAERRSKRNMTLHEKELDARVARLERDNALLISTLRVIASSFGMLERLWPDDGVSAAGGYMHGSVSSGARRRSNSFGGGREREERDREGVEVLMRELQRNAKRVSLGSGHGGRVRLEGSDEELSRSVEVH